jgi:hypothetical protein
MKLAIVAAASKSLLFGLLALSGCNVIVGISGPDLRATQVAMTWPTVAQEAEQTAQADVATAVAATLASRPTPDVEATVRFAEATQTAQPALIDTPTPTYTPPLTSTVILMSCHGWYVTAMADGTVQQAQELSGCGRFTLQRLDNGMVALKTCQNQWVTAPMTATTYFDWVVTQSPNLGDCGRFILHDLGHTRVAFETCAGRWLTAVNDKGEPGLEWYLIAHTYRMDAWETFTMQLQP